MSLRDFAEWAAKLAVRQVAPVPVLIDIVEGVHALTSEKRGTPTDDPVGQVQDRLTRRLELNAVDESMGEIERQEYRTIERIADPARRYAAKYDWVNRGGGDAAFPSAERRGDCKRRG